MNEDVNKIVETNIENQAQGTALLSKLVTAAAPQAVFGPPTAVGDEVIITASEVVVTMGYGFGLGGGSAQEPETTPADLGSAGGGGGGGGVAVGRPVAVIAIGPSGFRMNSVVDTQKIVQSVFRTIAAVAITAGRRPALPDRAGRRFRRGRRPAGFRRVPARRRPSHRAAALIGRLVLLSLLRNRRPAQRRGLPGVLARVRRPAMASPIAPPAG